MARASKAGSPGWRRGRGSTLTASSRGSAWTTFARRRRAYREIRLWGDPALRSTAPPLTAFDAALAAEVDHQAQVLFDAAGAGLAAPGAKVVLFGSRARGGERPNSDLDLLVIKRDEVENPRAESARLRGELRGLGVGLDLVVVSAGYAEEWGHLEGSLVNEALSEGRVLVEP